MNHRCFDRTQPTQVTVRSSSAAVPLAWLMLAALLTSPWARAAEPTPSKTMAATASAPASARSYSVLRGDTLDRVIQKTLPDSPLKIDILRKAFVELNPQAFVAGNVSRLQAGAVLQVPDPVQLLRASILPLLGAAEAAALSGEAKSAAGSGNGHAGERRNWVRFP
jgi:Tfp pilus assembly protein FimV